MTSRIHEIGHVCRLCLCKDGLISLSEATKSAITLEDIERCTSVKISLDDNLPYAICGKCHKTIETFVIYRGTCLRSDTIFKKLVILLSKFEVGISQSESLEISQKAKSTEIGNESWTGLKDDDPGACSAEESGARDHTDFDVEILHDSFGEKVTAPSSETLEKADGNRKDGMDREGSTACTEDTVITLDDEGSNDYQPTADGEVMDAAVSAAAKISETLEKSDGNKKDVMDQEGSAVCTEDTVITLDDEDSNDYKPSGDGEVINAEVNEAATQNADSDSDDSMISLYSEVMREMKKKENSSEKSDENRKDAMDPEGPAACTEETVITLEHEGSNDYKPSADGEVMDAEVNKAATQNADTDSDDSIISLYSEVMRGVKKKENSSNESTSNVDKKYRELCPQCGVMIRFLDTHIRRTHIKEKRFSCPYCPVKMSEKFFMREHINTVHEKRIILTCEQCGRGFINAGAHYYHMVNSHGLRDIYECDICHRKFKSFDGHKKHLKEHSLTALPCSYCGRLFKTMATLERHTLRYHPS